MEPTFFRPTVDDLSAYRESVARAEAAAVEVQVDDQGRTPERVVAPEVAEAVLVQASDQPLQPEETPGTPATAVVEETPVVGPPVEAEEPQLTPEQQRIAQLEAQLAEKEAMIGRQSAEVGQVRQEIASLREEFATRAAEPTAPVAAPIVITQDMIEDDPARATQIAYQQNDAAALERAFTVWKEIEPFEAASWRSDTLAQQREAAIRAEIQKDRERQAAEQQRAADTNAAWNGAMQDVAAVHADFLQVDPTTGKSNAERLLTEVAPQYPEVLAILRDGDRQAKGNALKLLYAADRANRTDPAAVQRQLEEAAAAAAAEEAAARAAAATVVGQPTAGQDPVALTDEQREQAAYAERAGHRPSLARGWTGRTA